MVCCTRWYNMVTTCISVCCAWLWHVTAPHFSRAPSLAPLSHPWFPLASVSPLTEEIVFVVSCPPYKKAKVGAFQLLLMSASAVFVQCVWRKGACHSGSYFSSSRYK